jgi:sialate O-acetylesterase
LVAKGGDLKTFIIAGKDGMFVPANARIDQGSVVVSNPEVTEPAAVRYAWENYPDGCNLYNGDGLPAPPFRTDKW